MTTTQQRYAYEAKGLVSTDLRYRRAMDMANEQFVASLERYFQARGLWGR